MRFSKMHGIGNDYIFVNCIAQGCDAHQIEHPQAVARFVSDRHFGIGGDGLVLICKSDKADALMKMYNADGSEGAMCGNAIRCVGKYLYDNHIVNKNEITVETKSGIKALSLTVINNKVYKVTVNMGEPVFAPQRIPMLSEGDSFINKPVTVAGNTMYATVLSIGNPHWVFKVDDIYSLDLNVLGSEFENYILFPDRVNTEFIMVKQDKIQMRVWERGSGETLACGTGACAAVVAASVNGWCGRSCDVVLKGGILHVDWQEESNCIFLTGTANHVFDGDIIF